MADTRVRLVFADDVGRHVQRRRGFSSCWHLVPRDAKLVGDLAHALLREFELRKSCPKGLELRLEELPLLATQSIRIVRDNDTIVVQCPPLGKGEDGSGEASSSESEAEAPKPRKRKLRAKETERQLKKKTKTVKDVVKEVGGRQSDKAKRRGKSEATTKPFTGKKESSKMESSDSSSSSSSSSSESSSSSSELEDDSAAQQKRKRSTTAATTMQQAGHSKGAASAKTTNGVASKAALPEQNGKEPRRRRRRLRQRSGGRARNGNQANMAENAASQPPPAASNGQERMAIAPEKTSHTSSSGSQVSNSIAGPRGYARAKAHVLFDEVTGDQVAVQHAENPQDTRESNWAPHRSQAPELAKYGPSSSDNQRPRAPRDVRVQRASPSNGLADRGVETNGYNGAPERKRKGKYEERWKRPYEIVATVLDKKKSNENSSSAPDLAKSMSSYPTAPAGSSCFEQKDVIAFKTLTLCLDTWQPVLSDWKCGQVQSTDGNSIEVLSWTLRANRDSVDFHEAPSGERFSVQTSELSELRFLSGPSHISLQQTAAQGSQEEEENTKSVVPV
ncbi:hypothetical protein PHYPSEUDO_002866 [Phytophthora pseudosyringae]|uniref:Coilin N-terminal domain-containing protein n=1 Tax=Phytophthora pseudosyringae TaxID=221518 RepID=A0A8T1VVD2_9STRA|nr:hypothetical protein PHYPSEUDO_002866 [Phytophthora pseudosyringae]